MSSQSFEDVFNNEIVALMNCNIQNVMEEAKSGTLGESLYNKIKNESKITGETCEYIQNLISTNKCYARFFAKDPLKQNIAEKIQLKLLHDKYPNIKKLSTSGKNSYFLSDGDICNGPRKCSVKSSTKTLDFFDPDTSTYFYAKYIKESGGAQDNQICDAENFLREAITFTNKNGEDINFCLVIDGDYAIRKYSRFKDILELAQLSNICICRSCGDL